ncbi:hypothetical protein [uncultured Gammaproteobacteria bacterium]|nr:hypothetical protein [uncultured Gammaproteobacteria bacterium]
MNYTEVLMRNFCIIQLLPFLTNNHIKQGVRWAVVLLVKK